MSYLGNTPTYTHFDSSGEQFSGTGAATVFTLARRVTNAFDLHATISNVLQDPFVAYSVTANTVSGTSDITFTSAPPSAANNIVITYQTGQLNAWETVKAGDILPGAVGTTAIADGAITTAKIADGTVIAADIADGTVTTAKLANSAVTDAKIDTVANTKVTGVMTTAQIADSAVTNVKIDSMANTKITGVITAAQIATVANTQITGVITAAQLASGITFPSSTIMTFQQTAAPTGWTKLTTHNDKAFRVVSGSASSGGSVAFTTAFASQAVAGTNASGAVSAHTLTIAEIPSHDHYLPRYTLGGGYQAPDDVSCSAVGAYEWLPSSATGGGGSHDHNFTQPTFSGTAINLAVSYIDLILAQKD